MRRKTVNFKRKMLLNLPKKSKDLVTSLNKGPKGLWERNFLPGCLWEPEDYPLRKMRDYLSTLCPALQPSNKACEGPWPAMEELHLSFLCLPSCWLGGGHHALVASLSSTQHTLIFCKVFSHRWVNFHGRRHSHHLNIPVKLRLRTVLLLLRTEPANSLKVCERLMCFPLSQQAAKGLGSTSFLSFVSNNICLTWNSQFSYIL